MRKKYTFWLIYLAFVIVAIVFAKDESPFISSGPMPFGKYLSWLAFIAFTIYSYHASMHENLFKTIKTMMGLYWGRQIGIDLYIGLMIFMPVIYLNEGSLWIALIWLIPVLAFANLATLLYLAINFDAIVGLIVK